MRLRPLPALVLLAAVAAGCAKTALPGASSRALTGPAAQAAKAKGDGVVLVGAGDIAYDGPGAEQTAKLLDQIPGTVFALGDNAYQTGSPDEFATYYHPTWGRHRARTRPAVGNHEYRTPGAAGYAGYFGGLAGPTNDFWYGYDAGPNWRVLVLNSNDDKVGVHAGSHQYAWIQAELAAAKGKNVLAYWHHPRFSTGAHGDHGHMQPIWELMVKEGVDLVLAGHDHDYERFHPTNAAGARDDRAGLISMVVGTGGKNHYPFFKLPKKTTAVRNANTFGVLKLTLRATDFEWSFVPVAGGKFTDHGAATVR